MSQGVAVSSVRQVLGRSRSLDQPCTPRLRGPTPEEMQQPASPSLSQHANSPAFSVAWPRDCLGRVRQRQPPPCASMHVPWRCSCCVIARGSRASRACASRAEVGVQVCWVKQCCILDNNHTAASNMKRAGDALAWWVEELPLLCPVALQFTPTRQLTPSSNNSFFFESRVVTSSQRQTLRH